MHTSATSRVIPVGYQVYELHLTGVTPLLMSNGEIDLDSDTHVAFAALSKKRSKTPEDAARLAELEWHTRLYYDAEIGIYIPSRNVRELLREAATKWKRGAEVKRSLVVPEYRIPLIYPGPRDPASLYATGRHAHRAMVSNSGAGSGRVMRTRPCFDDWQLRCEVAFDPADLSPDEVAMFVERAQKYGLGDWRPEFGSFQATLTFLREQRSDARADAAKPRDSRAEQANGHRASALLGSGSRGKAGRG